MQHEVNKTKPALASINLSLEPDELVALCVLAHMKYDGYVAGRHLRNRIEVGLKDAYFDAFGETVTESKSRLDLPFGYLRGSVESSALLVCEALGL